MGAVPAIAARRGVPLTGTRTPRPATVGGVGVVFGDSQGDFFAPLNHPSFFGAGVVAPPMSLNIETPTYQAWC